MTLRPAQSADCALLAQMNQRLIEDEAGRNPMTLEQLEDRMKGWLARGDYAIELILNPQPLGYLVYRNNPDNYFPQQRQVFLRQFFIERAFRRQGLGRAAVELWLATRVPAGSRVLLEVLASNHAGLAFWQSVGFDEFSLTMVLKK